MLYWCICSQTILHDGEEAAEKEFRWWLNMFGDDYYVELQRHNIKEQNHQQHIVEVCQKAQCAGHRNQ